MAIRPYKLLATSDLADGQFRSLQEVERYLQTLNEKISDIDGLIRQMQTQFARRSPSTASEFVFDVNSDDTPKKKPGGKISLDKIDKVVVPKLDVLKKNFEIVDELAEKIEQLDTIYNSVQVNFRGVRGANDTLANIKAMKANAEAKMKKALDFLNSIGTKHAPKTFKELVETTINYIEPSLQYKGYETSLYGYETEEGELAFSVYVKFSKLQDEDGEIHNQFFIVFTCVLKTSVTRGKVEPNYYVTVMNDFAVPGRFNLGRSVAHAAAATSAIGMLLELENISTAIGQVPHGLDSKRITRSKFAPASKIFKIHVEPNTIKFDLVKGVGKEEVNEIEQLLFQDMKGLLAHIKKANIKYKTVEENGRYVITFRLVNVAQSDQINYQDLDFLKEHFNLDETKLRQVIKIINGG